MKYEVRFQLDGEEHAEEVDAETAAEAAQRINDRHISSDETFELIQVQLLDEMPETTEYTEPLS